MEVWVIEANLTEGNSNDASRGAFAEARLPEEPGAGKPHAGIRGGARGNPRPYPDGGAALWM